MNTNQQQFVKPSDSERPIYCPHGHNVLWTTERWGECGACGAIMTEAAEERYQQSLVTANHIM